MMFLHKVIELFLSRRRRESPVVASPLPAYTQFYNQPRDIYEEQFYSNLIKTIAWTEKIIAGIPDLSDIDYSQALRTTNPLYNGRPFYSYGSESRYEFAATPEFFFDYSLLLKEALLLRNGTIEGMEEPGTLGKVLVFEIDLTTHDGAPVTESEGFVDESDIPPMDTWFFITKKHLYCWIPTLFIEKMQLAMNVEIMESYKWLELIDPSLNKRLLDRLKK